MKIIAVFHDNDIYSGATRSYLSNIEYLKSCGDDILGIIPQKNGELDEYLNRIGIMTIKCFYGGNVYCAREKKIKKFIGILMCILKSIVSYVSAVYLSTKLKNGNYDIVYTNTSTINLGYWLSKMLKIKHVWHFREFGYEDQDSLKLFEKSFVKKAENSEIIVTISNVLNNYYKGKYGLHNTIMLYDDLSREYRNPKTYKKDDRIINILITGTLSEGKGQFIAIKAIEKLGDDRIHLYLAGKINMYAQKLKEYVAANHVENIHFCGFVSNMKELRSKMDFSIVCSRSEAFGRTIIEDMLSEILVIGANKGSVPELIQNKKNGLLYNYGDKDSLSEMIKYAISNECDKEGIVAEGVHFAEQFTQQRTSQCIRQLFIKITKEKTNSIKYREM